MEKDVKEIEELVMTRLLKLNSVVMGVTAGLIFGLGIFLATIWLVVKGGPVIGPHLSLLGHFFIGYDVTVLGSFVGLFYGFVAGFLIGYVTATIYNWVVSRRERA